MTRFGRFISAVAVAVGGALMIGAAPANAQGAFQVTFPAGVACSGFDLSISGTGGNFTQRAVANGRIVSAGTGSNIVFLNLSTGATYTFKSRGGSEQLTVNANGSARVASDGNIVLVLFPTDSPAGPSTTVIVGRLVYNVDSAQKATVLATKGLTTDICAKLS